MLARHQFSSRAARRLSPLLSHGRLANAESIKDQPKYLISRSRVNGRSTFNHRPKTLTEPGRARTRDQTDYESALMGVCWRWPWLKLARKPLSTWLFDCSSRWWALAGFGSTAVSVAVSAGWVPSAGAREYPPTPPRPCSCLCRPQRPIPIRNRGTGKRPT